MHKQETCTMVMHKQETCTSKRHAQLHWSSVETQSSAAQTHHGHQANTLTAPGLQTQVCQHMAKASWQIRMYREHTEIPANHDPGGPLGSYYGAREKRETIPYMVDRQLTWIAWAALCDVSIATLLIIGSSSKRHGSAKHSHGTARDMAVQSIHMAVQETWQYIYI